MSAHPAGRMSVAAMAAMAAVIALLSIGCSQAPSTESPSSEATAGQSEATSGETAAKPSLERAREAGQMAVEMDKEPNRVTEILEAHHMTSEEFEALMFEIAQDPELTDAYETARTGS